MTNTIRRFKSGTINVTETIHATVRALTGKAGVPVNIKEIVWALDSQGVKVPAKHSTKVSSEDNVIGLNQIFSRLSQMGRNQGHGWYYITKLRR